MSTVLVTGATGNVGSRVVQELRGHGVAARAFVGTRAGRRPSSAQRSSWPSATSPTRPPSGPPSGGSAITLFLSCGNLPPQVAYETGVIDAAARAGVRRLVKLSALGAEPGSPVAFWDWHARIEEHLRASGIPAVVLRPRFFMTNLLASVETIPVRPGAVIAPADG